jgi:hypothetical protein
VKSVKEKTVQKKGKAGGEIMFVGLQFISRDKK